MKKTWHTVFLILLICLDAALLLLPLLPGYRALFDIGPYPDRLPAFRFLKLAGYALFFPLTAYGCGRLLARIRRPRLRWLPAAVFALIATALVCLHNNYLHMLCQLDSGWVHVPHMYENLVRADLTYRGGIAVCKRRLSGRGGPRGVCLRYGAVAASLRVFLPEHHRGWDRCHRDGGRSGKNRAGVLVPLDLRLPVFRPNAERMTGGRNIHI